MEQRLGAWLPGAGGLFLCHVVRAAGGPGLSLPPSGPCRPSPRESPTLWSQLLNCQEIKGEVMHGCAIRLPERAAHLVIHPLSKQELISSVLLVTLYWERG